MTVSALTADPHDGAAGRSSARPQTAAGRVLALLGAFAGGGGVLTLSEISRRAGLSLTTTHRLVREVLEWGGLEVDGSGRYRLSTKFLRLASTSTEGLRLRETALPHLMDLHRQIGGSTVHLAVREGTEVMYLEALRSYPNFTGESRIGGSLPLHAAAAGLVLLANASEDFIAEYVSRPLKRYTAKTLADPEELLAALATVRAQRYCVSPQSIAMDAGGIAAPIIGEDMAVKAAVNAVWFIEQQDEQRLTSLVRATANRISRALSGPRPPLDKRTVDFNRRQAGLG